MNKWMVDPPYLFTNEETETRLHAVVVAMRRCDLAGEAELASPLENFLGPLAAGVLVLPEGAVIIAADHFEDWFTLS